MQQPRHEARVERRREISRTLPRNVSAPSPRPRAPPPRGGFWHPDTVTDDDREARGPRAERLVDPLRPARDPRQRRVSLLALGDARLHASGHVAGGSAA